MIAVIPHVESQDIHNASGRRVIKKGDKTVSHGVNLDTGRNVALPCDPWESFVRQHCYYHQGAGEWILKD